MAPDSKTYKHTTTLQTEEHNDKENNAEAILESVPQVAPPYHESGTEVEFHKRSILT